MTDEQLKHVISQTRLGIERDEAEAKQRWAAAAEKRELLNVIEKMQNKIKQLESNQQIHNTYNIAHDFIKEQHLTIHPLNSHEQDH